MTLNIVVIKKRSSTFSEYSILPEHAAYPKLRTLLELSRKQNRMSGLYTSTKTSRKDNKLALRLVCIGPLTKWNFISIFIITNLLHFDFCQQETIIYLYRIQYITRNAAY